MYAPPRRDSETPRASVSLGKFLRRTSQFRGGNNELSTPEDELSSPKGFGFALATMRRFSRASAPHEPDALKRTLGDEPERQRRLELEVMSFATLHGHFEPAHAPELDHDGDVNDNQVEEALQLSLDNEREAVRRKSRETTADADDYQDLGGEDDRVEEENVLLLRLKSREEMASEASASMDHSDEDGSKELNFDQANLGASVRKLVLQIENASFNDGHDTAASVLSNQDEEDPHSQDDSAAEDDADHSARCSDPLADTKASRRVTYPMVGNNLYRAPPPRGLGQSCYIPMDEVQEDLTKSVRRLVIGLKREAEAQEDAHQGGLPFARRRGNSCPAAYTPPPTRSVAVDSSASTAVSMSMETGPAEPPRWRKRSAFARLAPKFLDNFRRKRKSYLYTDEELESIEGARWKIVELAFRFGGKHRFYLVQAVNMFFPLTKYGRHGGPHPTRLHCNRCGTLQWQHKRGGLSEAVDLADVLQVIEGRQTAVFRKYAFSKPLDSCSLSLIFKERTLDLETASPSHRDWLMSALRTLVTYAKKQRQAEQRAIAEKVLLPLDDATENSTSMRRHAEYLTKMTSPHGSNVGPMMLW